MPNSRSPRDHVPLPAHHFEILVTLSGGENHGYRIVKDIEQRTSGDVVLGSSSLYAAIKRLVENGLIQDAGDRAGGPSGGPPRRYYRITDLGREVVRLDALRIQRAASIVLEQVSSVSHAKGTGR